jgi:hypothetical protein
MPVSDYFARSDGHSAASRYYGARGIERFYDKDRGRYTLEEFLG